MGRLIWPELRGSLHEVSPDRQRWAGAFQIEVAVIVEAYPHHTQELAGEPGEPAIMGCAGLAAAGSVNPRDLTPAPVPLRKTSCIMLTIR